MGPRRKSMVLTKQEPKLRKSSNKPIGPLQFSKTRALAKTAWECEWATANEPDLRAAMARYVRRCLPVGICTQVYKRLILHSIRISYCAHILMHRVRDDEKLRQSRPEGRVILRGWSSCVTPHRTLMDGGRAVDPTRVT